MKFEKYKFEIVKKAIDKNLANFLFNYLKLKNKYQIIYKNKISFTVRQINGFLLRYTNSKYIFYLLRPCDGDIVNVFKNTIEKKTKTKLIETYSYARLYKQGDILFRHKDRSSCAISATVNLGGDPWPIYLNTTNNLAQDGFKVDLTPVITSIMGDKNGTLREEFHDISGQGFYITIHLVLKINMMADPCQDYQRNLNSNEHISNNKYK